LFISIFVTAFLIVCHKKVLVGYYVDSKFCRYSASPRELEGSLKVSLIRITHKFRPSLKAALLGRLVQRLIKLTQNKGLGDEVFCLDYLAFDFE